MDKIDILLKNQQRDSDKLDNMQNDISAVKVDVAVNTADLKEHMRRTSLLESEVKIIKSDTKYTQDHVTKVEFFFKTIKWVGIPTIIAGIGYLIKIYSGN